MALWEYKVITSGQHGFASPALLEAHLNSLGKDEWEIVHFQTMPNNALAFHGLVRRSTLRDWTPPEVAPVVQPRPSAYEPAPKAADKFAEEKPETPPALAGEDDHAKPAAAAASLRTVRNTERDNDPDAEDEAEDWDNWEDNQDELPTFFEAIKPHLRRNQKGPGNSVALEHLARRWEQREADLVGALKECGFTVPESEDAEPEYFEFEGDLYWVNRNNRGQLFINSREKPRPVFRTVAVKKLLPDDPATAELVAERTAEKAEIEKRKNERTERQAAADAATAAREAARAARQQQQATASAASAATDEAAVSENAPPSGPAEPLPPGAELLAKIRPQMRRNRRGPGYSGSVGFLARAFKQSEADLTAALAALGLNVPADANDKPVYVEIDGGVYWMNKDGRGGVWINGREKKEGGGAPTSAQGNGNDGSSSEADQSRAEGRSDDSQVVSAVQSTASPSEEQPSLPLADTQESTSGAASERESSDEPGDSALAAVRLLLKANKRGSGVSGEVGFLARTLGKSDEAFLATLTGAGIVVPADSEEKPVFVEQAGEIFWLNKNSKDGSLWLNAKAAKSAAKKPSGASVGGSRPRTRKPKADKAE